MMTLLLLCIYPFCTTFDADAPDPGKSSVTIEKGSVALITPPVQMPGWPQTVGVHPNYKPSGVALVDITGDGMLDVIVGSTDNTVYAWDCQGNALPGWPITLSGMVQSKVAIGDIDNNGDQEVVIATRNGYVHAYNHNGSVCTGWPQNANGTIGLVSPALFDLDLDGDLEIIMVQMQSGQPGHVYVWHHDGTAYSGWPQNMDYLGVATAAVGDIDNDSIFEICALAYRSVYVWDQNGIPEPGWPKLNVASGMSYAQPVFADLDDDGDLEVLHSYYLSGQDYVGIYHHDGSAFSNWPQTYPGPQTYTTPVTGDIDDDWDLEIFGGGHVFGAPGLLARHHTSGQVSGWPVTVDGLECSPIVLDIDDDGGQEILAGDNYTPGSFYAYEGNGTPVIDWPVVTTAATMVNSAAAADVDGDGDIEIALVVNDGTVNLWTLDNVPYRGYLTQWRTGFHDNWNTGWLHPKPPQNLVAYAFAPDTNWIEWEPNTESDLAGYNVYRSLVSGGPYSRVNTSVIIDTIFVDDSLPFDSIYYYCATAVTKGMAESRLSNEDSATMNITEHHRSDIVDYQIFPNPFTRYVIFPCHQDIHSYIAIYDVKGACVETIKGSGALIWRPELYCAPGVYFVRIERNNRFSYQKIIKLE